MVRETRTHSMKQKPALDRHSHLMYRLIQLFCFRKRKRDVSVVSKLIRDNRIVRSVVFRAAGGVGDDRRLVGAGRVRSWETSHLNIELQREKSEQTL